MNIGCFGAVRLLKNQLNQAIAAISWARKNDSRMKFHINVGREEGPQATNVLKALRALFGSTKHCELVEHSWYSHEDFLRVVKGMDLVSQVSFTETFNIVTADAVTCKVPVLVSDEVSWLPPKFHCSPTKVESIEAGIDRLLFNRELVCREASKALEDYNEWALDRWYEFSQILG